MQTFGEYFSCLLSSTVNKQLLMLLRKANDDEGLKPSMANARLNGLALAYIYKPTEIDSSSVLKRWDASGHRRIALAFRKE